MAKHLEADELYEARAKVLKALASPVRLKIIDVLAEGELCVADIAEAVGAERSNVSRHLSVLANSDILGVRKEGLCVYYDLRFRCVLDFFGCASAVIREQLGANAKLLAAISKASSKRSRRT